MNVNDSHPIFCNATCLVSTKPYPCVWHRNLRAYFWLVFGHGVSLCGHVSGWDNRLDRHHPAAHTHIPTSNLTPKIFPILVTHSHNTNICISIHCWRLLFCVFYFLFVSISSSPHSHCVSYEYHECRFKTIQWLDVYKCPESKPSKMAFCGYRTQNFTYK